MRIHDLSDEQLLASLHATVRKERSMVARIVAYLAEVEERRIHLEQACSSMYELCIRKLGLSDSEAYRRLAVARLVRPYPQILDALAEGKVLLSNVVLLRPLFTPDNVDELLAAGKTKRAVEELVARLAPKPDVEASIRTIPEQASLAEPEPASASPAAPGPRAIAPLAEERFSCSSPRARRSGTSSNGRGP